MNDISIEGIILPNKALSDYELIDSAKKLGIKNFKGAYCRDEITYINDTAKCSECGILNLDTRSGIGTHWVCWFIRRGAHETSKYYFDSFGIQPPLELIKCLKSPIYYNSDRVQPSGSVICGHLCLYVLKKLSDGEDFQVVINSLI